MKRLFLSGHPLAWLLLAVLAVGLGPVLGARMTDDPNEGYGQTMNTDTKATQAQEGDR